MMRQIVLILAFVFVSSAHSQSETDLAKKTQNPVADLISLPFQNNTNFEWGEEDKTENTLNIQPVIPISLGDDWNLITRTILPVKSQPGPVEGVDRENGLGDTSFTAFLSPKNSSEFVWGAGPVLLLPTATDDRLGCECWGAGPSVVALQIKGPWVVGSLVSQVWDLEGSDEDVSLFTWQYFVNYNFSSGWYLTSSPIITANWEGESGEKWTVPVGGGAGRVVRIGKLPVNLQAQAFYNVEAPDGLGDWSTRLQFAFLLPKGGKKQQSASAYLQDLQYRRY